ncbi:hypothetical protein HK098_003264 [Nowakowskiella sp. JEL0407]|nr:hypothetical protein HK098_003264 [Nowakowskiella sp. JEL0407]
MEGETENHFALQEIYNNLPTNSLLRPQPSSLQPSNDSSSLFQSIAEKSIFQICNFYCNTMDAHQIPVFVYIIGVRALARSERYENNEKALEDLNRIWVFLDFIHSFVKKLKGQIEVGDLIDIYDDSLSYLAHLIFIYLIKTYEFSFAKHLTSLNSLSFPPRLHASLVKHLVHLKKDTAAILKGQPNKKEFWRESNLFKILEQKYVMVAVREKVLRFVDNLEHRIKEHNI